MKVGNFKIKVGSYEKDGQTKGKYIDLGVLMQSQDGGMYALVNPYVNLAGVPIGEGKDMVMVSVFMDQPRQQNNYQQPQPQQPQQQAPQQQTQQQGYQQQPQQPQYTTPPPYQPQQQQQQQPQQQTQPMPQQPSQQLPQVDVDSEIPF